MKMPLTRRLNIERWGIRNYLFGFSVIFVFAFLLISAVISYKIFMKQIVTSAEKLERSSFEQVSNKINAIFSEVERLTVNFSSDPSLISVVNNLNVEHKTTYDYINSLRDVINRLIAMKICYEDINMIILKTDSIVINSEGQYDLYRNNKFDEMLIYKKLQTIENRFDIIEPGVVNPIRLELDQEVSNLKEHNPLLTFSKKIVFSTVLHSKDNEFGIIYIVMTKDWIKKVLGDADNILITSEDGNNYIWNPENHITSIYEKIRIDLDNQSENIKEKYEGQYYKIQYIRFRKWYIIRFISLKAISSLIEGMNIKALIIIIISIILSFFLANFFSLRITKPIDHLISNLKNYKIGQEYQVNIKKVRFSIRDYLMLYFIISLVIPMMFFNVVFYYSSSKILIDKVAEAAKGNIAQTIDSIDSFVKINKRISLNIIINKDVQSILQNSWEYQYENNQAYDARPEHIRKAVDENIILGGKVFDVNLYSNNGRLVFSTSYNSDEKISEEVYKEINTSFGEVIWIYTGKDKYERNVMKLIRKVNTIGSSENSLDLIGYLQITYSEDVIEDLYHDIRVVSNSVYLVDNNGVIVSHKNKNLIGTTSEELSILRDEVILNKVDTKTGNHKLVLGLPCRELPISIITEINYDEFLKDSKLLLNLNIYIIGGIVFIAIIISYLLSIYFSRSFNVLINNIEKMGKGKFDVDYSTNTYFNEIYELSMAFNNMCINIHELIEKVYKSQIRENKLESDKKQAEIIALQAQINPHFLYNTLESIKWMIRANNGRFAEEMITSLSDIFRFGIGREDPLVSIEEEIKYAQAYVDIQKTRLGNRISFIFEVDTNIMNYKTLKLTLQPLIENSIMHGLIDKEGTGCINIDCHAENDNIIFKIVDDGMGMEKDRLEDIRLTLKDKLASKSIGIYNVQKRVQLYFGEDYGLTIKSQLRAGTIVKLIIPKVI